MFKIGQTLWAVRRVSRHMIAVHEGRCVNADDRAVCYEKDGLVLFVPASEAFDARLKAENRRLELEREGAS